MNLELIHKYLNSEMTNQEYAAFELRMLKDPELAEEVALQKDMISFSASERKVSNARNTIKEIGKSYQPDLSQKLENEKANKTSKLFYFIPISIAAFLLIGFFINQLMTTQDMSSEAIYAEYANISNLSFVSRNNQNDNSLLAAQDAFNARDYSRANIELENIIVNNPKNLKALYYRAYSKINSGNISGGRQDLTKLLDNVQYKNSAYYQLGLSFIKTNQYEEAIGLFRKIDKTSNHYDNAQELIGIIQ